MQLIHDRAEGYFFIRAISHQVARVIDRDLHTSFVICVDRVVENWTPTRVEEIDDRPDAQPVDDVAERAADLMTRKQRLSARVGQIASVDAVGLALWAVGRHQTWRTPPAQYATFVEPVYARKERKAVKPAEPLFNVFSKERP